MFGSIALVISYLTTAAIYLCAAIAEIAGCFEFWAWLRLGKSVWWVMPGMVSHALFAWLLAKVDTPAAGRAYATYGGVYIVASLIWLGQVEGVRPDRWNFAGMSIGLPGAALILFASGRVAA